MTRRPAPLARAVGVLAGAALLAVPGPVARADDVIGYLELQAAEAEATEELFGLPAAETRTEFVNRRLYLNASRQVSPWVRLWGGGTFDDADASFEFEGNGTDSDEWRLRPYLGLGRQTPHWLTQLSWSRDQRKTEVAGQSSLETIRDAFFGTLAWAPEQEDLPRARLSLSRALDRDGDRRLRDQVSDLADLTVTQQVVPSLRWTYRGTHTGREDRILGSDATTTAHRGEVAYTEQWLDRHVLFHAQFAVNRVENRVESRSGADVDLPLFPATGLVNRDDTPLDGLLATAPGLIDDDLAVPTIVDLGLPQPGPDPGPWGVGLDFGLTMTVNTLFVWVDRDVRADIAQTLDWQVYTSPNGSAWVPRASVAAAPFDEFQRRWEIRFPELTTRYVKLVVRPLDPAVPDADLYPDLFVTELDAAQRVAAAAGRRETHDTLQSLNADVRARLLARRDLFYFGNLNWIDSSRADADYRLSNGLSYLHPLAPEATLTSRLAWEESREAGHRDRALVYSASLQVVPVERLQYTLSLSGRDEDVADEIGGDQVSLFFYGAAALLAGLDLQLSVGRSYLENTFGDVVPSTQLDFGARIEPRDDLLLQLNYTDTQSEARVGAVLAEDVFTRAGEVNATYTPVSTVYLFGAYRLEWRSDLRRDTIRRSTLSFTPFPQAAFRLALSYDETRRDLGDERQRSYGPTLRWNFNPRSYLELAWFNVLDEQTLARFENRILSAILRWGF